MDYVGTELVEAVAEVEGKLAYSLTRDGRRPPEEISAGETRLLCPSAQSAAPTRVRSRRHGVGVGAGTQHPPGYGPGKGAAGHDHGPVDQDMGRTPSLRRRGGWRLRQILARASGPWPIRSGRRPRCRRGCRPSRPGRAGRRGGPGHRSADGPPLPVSNPRSRTPWPAWTSVDGAAHHVEMGTGVGTADHRARVLPGRARSLQSLGSPSAGAARSATRRPRRRRAGRRTGRGLARGHLTDRTALHSALSGANVSAKTRRATRPGGGIPASSEAAPASSRRRTSGSASATIRRRRERERLAPTRGARRGGAGQEAEPQRMAWGRVRATTLAPRSAAADPAPSWSRTGRGSGPTRPGRSS